MEIKRALQECKKVQAELQRQIKKISKKKRASSSSKPQPKRKPLKVASPSSKAKRFKRPRGRAPKGKVWDYAVGKWKDVPGMKGKQSMAKISSSSVKRPSQLARKVRERIARKILSLKK